MHSTRLALPSAWNCLTSSLTHFEAAALGEQITINASEARSASTRERVRLCAEDRSSRSRNTGEMRRGSSPPMRGASLAGTR